MINLLKEVVVKIMVHLAVLQDVVQQAMVAVVHLAVVREGVSQVTMKVNLVVVQEVVRLV